MKYILLLLLTSACASSRLIVDNKVDLVGIPRSSPAVIATSSLPADSLFIEINRMLVQFGWVVRSSKEALQISCDGRELKGHVFVKPVIQIEKGDESHSKALFMGQWATGQTRSDELNFWIGPYVENPQKITWQGQGTQPGDAYQHLVRLAKRVPASTISFLRPKKNANQREVMN